jgi:hypothetical protein
MFATEIMPHLRGIHGQPEGQQPALAAAD